MTAGKIIGYSYLPMVRTTIEVQSGNGPILAMNKENMLKLVATHPKAAKLVGKGKLLKALLVFNED